MNPRKPSLILTVPGMKLVNPYDQHGRGQREVVFAAERFQSLGQEGEEH